MSLNAQAVATVQMVEQLSSQIHDPITAMDARLAAKWVEFGDIRILTVIDPLTGERGFSGVSVKYSRRQSICFVRVTQGDVITKWFDSPDMPAAVEAAEKEATALYGPALMLAGDNTSPASV